MKEDTSKVYSPSRLDTYRNCPRQYKFRYIDRIARRFRSVEAHLGTCVHEALEALYDAILHGRTPSEAEVADVFEKAWARDLEKLPLVIHDKKYGLEDWRRVGRDCLRVYDAMTRPFDGDRTIAVERRVGFSLRVEDAQAGSAETVRIEGYVDRLALNPEGGMEIHDYKTGATLPTQRHVDEEDWQLPMYHLAVMEAWPDTPAVRLNWHYVRHGKTLRSCRSPEQLGSLRESIRELILAIRRDRTFEPIRSPLCDWCDYRNLCPLWKHEESCAGLPQAQRRLETGVALADRYANLDRRKKALREEITALESEQEDLESRIIEYARERQVTSLCGSDATVDIHEKEELHLPTKTRSPEAYERIESQLKLSPSWPEMSRLDGRVLMEGYQKKRWPEAVLRLIEGWIGSWIRRATTRTLRVHRRKGAPDE
ncbi:MAG: PD-(D/E)XK nuclease family protein [Elusimicrobia bacterium]|nr:PD-(D/E)XK nuclease family protein [Elusimicrobiota bacterium]